MDWSAWRQKLTGRELVYEVQNYPMANLQVHSGDRIRLVPPPGGNAAGLAFNFVGYSPCAAGTNAATCLIDPQADSGPYLFTCTSSQGYSCPEPGVQQSPTGPINRTSYAKFVVTDFDHLLGIHPSPVAEPAPPTAPGAHPATNAVTAYVSCQNNATVLQDPNGKPLTTITAPKGDSVFWISAKTFSLDTSTFPAGLCSNGNPGSGETQQAQCDIAMSGKTIPYKVQAQTTPACGALAATLVTQ
ncbi:MAG TPA: hypothetical protein VHX13_01590 [Acidobacteriaceae bacterium]|nr:hypothetical protein [Acidobacteriaceae bacterium]